MHFVCQVARYQDEQEVFQQISGEDVPPMQGVEIDWSCGGDLGQARATAIGMRQTYGIDYLAVLGRNHIRRLAVNTDI